METVSIELTTAQKGLLATLSQETGAPVSDLIDRALDDLQEHLRAKRTAHFADRTQKPVWEVIIEAGSRIPEKEMEGLPADLAANVDHYAYGLPKRFE